MIDIIVGKEAIKGLKELEQELIKSDKLLVEMAQKAVELNKSLSKIKLPSDLAKSQLANEKLNESLLRQAKLVVDLETKLQRQAQAQITASQKALEAKEKERLSEIKLAQDREKAFDRHEKEILKEVALKTKSGQESLRNANINYQLNRSYNILSAQVKLASDRYQDLMVRGRLANQSQASYNSELRNAEIHFKALQKRILDADKAVDKWNRTGQRSVAMGRQLMSAFGIVGGVTLFTNLVKDIFNTSKELEALNKALEISSADASTFAINQEFLRKTSEDLGIEIQQLTRLYTQFYVSAKDKISLSEIQSIFGSVAKAGASMGLSLQQQDRAFLAINQMMSKGTIMAEELRGQLGEALPGALSIMAKSIGVTEKEMAKMMQKGELISKDVLPKFAKALEEAYGIENIDRIETMVSIQNRLTNSWTNFIDSIGRGNGVLSNFFKSAFKLATDFIDFLSEVSKTQEQTLNSVYASSYAATVKNLNERKKLSKEAHLYELQFAQESVSNTINQIEFLKKWQNEVKNEIELRKESGMSVVDYYKKTKELKNVEGQIEGMNKQLQEQKGYYDGLLTVLEDKKKIEDNEDTEGKKRRERIKIIYDSTESEKALAIAILERQRAEAKDRMDNDLLDYDARLRGSEDFYKKELELFELYKELEIEVVERKNREDVEKNRVAFANKNIDEKLYNDNVRELAEIRTAELEKIEVNYSLKLNDIVDARFDFIKKVNDEYYKQDNERLDLTVKNEQARTKVIFENNGLTRKARLDAHKEFIHQTKVQMDMDKARELANSKSEQERLNIIERYRQAFEELEISSKITEATFESMFEKMSGQLVSTSSDGFGFLDTIFDSQISNYDRLIEKNNEYYDALLSNVESGSAQEIALLEEKSRKEEELQRKKAEIERKQAVFRKLASITEIAINTAVAISAALRNPNTASFVVPFIIAQGAIQTATVLATPIPQYKDGTKSHKGGDAIVGDGGKHEVMITPDGKTSITPNVPTLVNDMPKGTVVLPDASAYFLNFKQKGTDTKAIELAIEKGFKKAKINNYMKFPKINLGHENYKHRGL